MLKSGSQIFFSQQLFGAESADNQDEFVPASLKTVEIGNTRINAQFFNKCVYIHNIILPIFLVK